jgi:hypothetical protein
MPISNGTYTIPSGATTAASGQTVQSAVWNSIFGDIQTALGSLASNNYYGVPGNRNILCDNGSFDIWQRGVSISQNVSTTAYTCDRWYLITNANQVTNISRAVGLTSKSQYSCGIQRNAGQTGVGTYTFGYPLDSDEIGRLRNSKIYISYTAIAGANFSAVSGTIVASFYVGTGAPTKRLTGAFTSETLVATVSTNLTLGVATSISVTSAAVIPTTATQAEIQFTWTPVGTAGVVDAINFDDVQIQIVPDSGLLQSTTYDYIPFEQCLKGCKRFYDTTINYGTTVAQNAGLSGALSVMTQNATRFACLWVYPNELRSNAPTITTYNPSGASANWQDFTATASLAATIDTANGRGSKSVLIYGATAVAIDHLIYIHASADASI